MSDTVVSDATPTSTVSSKKSSVAAGVFKRPLGVPYRRRRSFRTVLDEDTYVAELEDIIERDFFPSLKRLRVQNDYLQAMNANDNVTMSRLRAQYSSTGRSRAGLAGSDRQRVHSPATFETPDRPDPSSSPASSAGYTTTASVNDCASEAGTRTECGSVAGGSVLSLDAYLSTHSSEDNESFEDIMEACRLRERVARPWLFNTETPHNQRQASLLSASVPAITAQADSRSQQTQVATWPYRADNELMYPPTGAPLTPAELVQQRAAASQQVVHAGTRLPSGIGCRVDEGSREQLEQAALDARRRRLHGKVGLDGRDLLSAMAAERQAAVATSAGQASPAAPDSAAAAGLRYDLVRTPSPAPGVNESPLMTWGEIDGTPFRLDGGATPLLGDASRGGGSGGTSFRIAAPPRREQLALKLAGKHSAHHRDKKERALEAARRSMAVASPAVRRSSLVEKMDTLSPAARRLASRGTPNGHDDALRRSYTPTRRSAGAGGGSTPSTPGVGTPASTSAAVRQHAASPARITDNLLRLPVRKRAVDFF